MSAKRVWAMMTCRECGGEVDVQFTGFREADVDPYNWEVIAVTHNCILESADERSRAT